MFDKRIIYSFSNGYYRVKCFNLVIPIILVASQNIPEADLYSTTDNPKGVKLAAFQTFIGKYNHLLVLSSTCLSIITKEDLKYAICIWLLKVKLKIGDIYTCCYSPSNNGEDHFVLQESNSSKSDI